MFISTYKLSQFPDVKLLARFQRKWLLTFISCSLLLKVELSSCFGRGVGDTLLPLVFLCNVQMSSAIYNRRVLKCRFLE